MVGGIGGIEGAVVVWVERVEAVVLVLLLWCRFCCSGDGGEVIVSYFSTSSCSSAWNYQSHHVAVHGRRLMSS